MVIDFRRAGGKKPSVRRGRRAISTGAGKVAISTQESCVHGASGSREVLAVSDGEAVAVLVKEDMGG